MKAVNDYFKQQTNFQAALIHRSYCNEHPGTVSNERLEFLGDSVLSLITSNRLFHLFPDLPEGELTARRSLIVQTSTLAEKAKVLGLDELLMLSRGEQDLGGRKNPSLLANTFEAVLGSLYLDSGIEVCQSYLEEIFTTEEILAHQQIKDPKSLLQEHAQAKGMGTPTYDLVSSIGPDHAKNFTVAVTIAGKVITSGDGASKQKAEIEAAKAALEQLFPENMVK